MDPLDQPAEVYPPNYRNAVGVKRIEKTTTCLNSIAWELRSVMESSGVQFFRRAVIEFAGLLVFAAELLPTVMNEGVQYREDGRSKVLLILTTSRRLSGLLMGNHEARRCILIAGS